MSYLLSKELVILSEGPADQAFLSKLLASRSITDFDIPRHKEDLNAVYGKGAFGKMFSALAGDAKGYSELKGVLIVADSGDCADSTVRFICERIEQDGPFDTEEFKRPLGTNTIVSQPSGHPCVAIMLLPLEGSGALETICVNALIEVYPWLD